MDDSKNLTKFVGYGLRELNSNETLLYCNLSVDAFNKTVAPVLNTTNTLNLTNNFYYRFYMSGCYFLDKRTAAWSTYEVRVQPDTNTTHTHCVTSHLTDFAGADIEGSLIVLPAPIDFNYVFAHASFAKNMTIYLTVIITASIYIILAVICLWLDKRDELKTKIHLLEGNNPFDFYFYEMIVMTGNRKYAGTESTVTF
jgi:hypothetical protein